MINLANSDQAVIQRLVAFFTKGHERSIKAKKNIIYSFAIKGVSIIIQLILVPLYLAYLDNEKYGVWLTLSSIINWFHFFDIGLGNGLRNKLTEALAKGDNFLAKTYVSTSYFLHSLIFGSLSILFLIINPYLHWNEILNTSLISAGTLNSLARLIFLLFMARFILMQIAIISYSHQMPSLNNAFLTSSNLLLLLVVFLLSRFTDDNILFLGFSIGFIPVIVFAVATIILFNGKFRAVRPSILYIDLKLSKNILNLGVKFFLVQTGAIIVFSSSNFLISHFFGPEKVTPYNIAFKYFQIPVMIYAVIMAPIWSAVTDAYAQKDMKWLKNIIKKLNKLSLVGTIGIVAMLLLSPVFYRIWIGNGVTIPFKVSVIMAIWAALNIFSSPYANFINGIGKLKLSISLFWILIPLFFIFAMILIKTPLEYAGIMAATCAINGISAFMIFIQVTKILSNTAKGIWNS